MVRNIEIHCSKRFLGRLLTLKRPENICAVSPGHEKVAGSPCDTYVIRNFGQPSAHNNLVEVVAVVSHS